MTADALSDVLKAVRLTGATFFDLVKDREAVSEMLAEVIGAPAAKCHLTDSGSQKKTIIKMALAGDGRSKVEAWTPYYMQFPQAAYTARPLTAGDCRPRISSWSIARTWPP